MIDSHSHIDADEFDADRDEVLSRAWMSGVESIILPDIEPGRRQKLINVVNSDHRLCRGIGIHPHHVAMAQPSDLSDVEAQCRERKVVAIGEIGIDYYYDFAPADVQKSYFRAQLNIAKRNDLPVIVHNREADDDILDIIQQEQDGSLRGVLHCFSSGINVLERAMELGFHISFTGNITFKKTTLDEVVRAVPENRFMIETDAPYITPVPYRGKRNEPSYVRLVAEKIAELRNMTIDQVDQATSRTAKAFFRIATLLIIGAVSAAAQPSFPNEEDYEHDRDWEIAVSNYIADSIAYEKWIKPRKIGIGFSIGSNTTVEGQQFMQRYNYTYSPTSAYTDPGRWTLYQRQKGPTRSFSYDGLLTYGATLTYAIATPLVIEATYLYTLNDKPAREFGLDPITTNIIELTGLYSLNPYNKINFIPQAGVTYATTNDGTLSTTKFGVNGGLGLGANIPTTLGLFYPMINVRFNFMFGTDQDRIVAKYVDVDAGTQWNNSANPSLKSEDKADVTTIYSVIRLTVLYYFSF
ncbi:MAG: TatD family hydrolase [Ignavibacteria bacterium]|nr:TatD family hydrolase [Ignavibacteria bacterium]